jgi:hypothetical protein
MCSGSLRKPNLLYRSYWHDKALDRIFHRTPDSIWTTNQVGIHPCGRLERMGSYICAHNCPEG